MLESDLLGLTREHIVQRLSPRYAAKPPVIDAFERMRAAAARDGIDLTPVSSFRDFQTQLRIWNHKFEGRKVLYDLQGRPRDRQGMSDEQVVEHILNWSALPGGSRHHWGTEIDVMDAAAVPTGYAAKLLPEEVMPGGPFERLHRWLDVNMAEFGFFRPYNYFQSSGGIGPSGEPLGGMFPEPWHLSYAPLSMELLPRLSVDVLARAMQGAEMFGKSCVLDHLEALHKRHVLNIVPPDAQRPFGHLEYAHRSPQ